MKVLEDFELDNLLIARTEPRINNSKTSLYQRVLERPRLKEADVNFRHDVPPLKQVVRGRLRVARGQKEKPSGFEQAPRRPKHLDGLNRVLDHLDGRDDVEGVLLALHVSPVEDGNAVLRGAVRNPAFFPAVGFAPQGLPAVTHQAAIPTAKIEPAGLPREVGEAANGPNDPLPFKSADGSVRVLQFEQVVHERVRTAAAIVIFIVDVREIVARIGHKREAAVAAASQLELFVGKASLFEDYRPGILA